MNKEDILIYTLLLSIVLVVLYKAYQHLKTPQANRFKAYYDSSGRYKQIIFINYGFKTGNEKSLYSINAMIDRPTLEPDNIYLETSDMNCFKYSYLQKVDDVVVLLKDGRYISLYELFNHKGLFFNKRITKEHNISYMLECNMFKFIPFDSKKYKTNRKTQEQI